MSDTGTREALASAAAVENCVPTGIGLQPCVTREILLAAAEAITGLQGQLERAITVIVETGLCPDGCLCGAGDCKFDPSGDTDNTETCTECWRNHLEATPPVNVAERICTNNAPAKYEDPWRDGADY